jgi:hypothetical protein
MVDSQSRAAKPSSPAPKNPGMAVAAAKALLLLAAELASALALLAAELASLMALLMEEPAAPPMPTGAVALGTGGLLASSDELVMEEMTEDRLDSMEERVESRSLDAAAAASVVVLSWAVIRFGVVRVSRRRVSMVRMVVNLWFVRREI